MEYHPHAFSQFNNFHDNLLVDDAGQHQHQHQSIPCVISDLFDITEADWFSSRLDKSPSLSASIPDSEHNQSNHNYLSILTQPSSKHIELEVLTPENDTPEISFNVLTSHQNEHTPVNNHLSLDVPLEISESIHLSEGVPFDDELTFSNHDLLNKYTNLNDYDEVDDVRIGFEEDDNVPKNVGDSHSSTPAPTDETTITVEPETNEEILETLDHGLNLTLDDEQIDIDNLQSHLLGTTMLPPEAEAEDMTFDEFYSEMTVSGHPLPDVHTYIAALTGTAPLMGRGSISPRSDVKAGLRTRKRKMSKREAAREASAAEMAREEELARLAKAKQITDDELLKLKPKKQRRAARFDKPVPSRFCHVCSRTPKNVRLVVCCKIKEGVCRKVICEKCFEEYKWGNFDEAMDTDSSEWVCPHCSGKCPERAQCRTYQRINDRLRVNRLKQERRKSGKRRTKRQIEERFDVSDDKRPKFLLPAVIGDFGGIGIGQGIDTMGENEIGVGEGLNLN